MRAFVVPVLSTLTLLLQGQSPGQGPVRIASGACKVTFQGRVERSAVLIQSGSPPHATQATEEFTITLPGRIEMWELAPGRPEFRFIPDSAFAEARGRFKTSQTVTRPMIQSASTVEGEVVAGMGTWYLNASNVGGQVIPANTDVTMRGKVTASTDPNLVVGRNNVPVSVLVVPIILTKDRQTTMPPLRFTGVSLWALQKNRTPFSAQGELVYAHRGERDTVRGTVNVTFDIDPTR
jgi:hypothetical protein